METPTEYTTEARFDPRNGYRLDIYCPSCGEHGSIERLVPFELSPGAEGIVCPNCLQHFYVEIEFIPLDTQPEKVYNDCDARECVNGEKKPRS